MSKGVLFLILGVLIFIICGGMYVVGGNSSNLSELKDFWYMPLPLGVILAVIGLKKMGGGCAGGG